MIIWTNNNAIQTSPVISLYTHMFKMTHNLIWLRWGLMNLSNAANGQPSVPHYLWSCCLDLHFGHFCPVIVYRHTIKTSPALLLYCSWSDASAVILSTVFMWGSLFKAEPSPQLLCCFSLHVVFTDHCWSQSGSNCCCHS